MDTATPKPASSRILKWFLIIFFFLVFYVVTCIPVGLFLYTAKSNLGINVFSKTGFHSYAACLKQEARKVTLGDTKEPTREEKRLTTIQRAKEAREAIAARKAQEAKDAQ